MTKHTFKIISQILLVLALLVVIAWLLFRPKTSPDILLQKNLRLNAVLPLDFNKSQDPQLVTLGEALFYDKELSGNRDTSCATCHHPTQASGDSRPLPIGAGGVGLGATRAMEAATDIVPRNAPELFNRGSAAWTTMFWDGRITFHAKGDIDSPAGVRLPAGLDSALATQALFPPTSRAEMRGNLGQNELADFDETDVTAIWNGIVVRLRGIPAYHSLFSAAFPDLAPEQWTMAHVGNAIAAYEIAAFTFEDAPWDRYLNGELEVLSAEQKRGALLFYSPDGCVQCHKGSLLTDQQYHNIGVPHAGPGKNILGIDYGRALVTGQGLDNFTFRTPPLRNVALTAPYMHNGYYKTLPEVLDHHLNAAKVLATYPEGFADIGHATAMPTAIPLREHMAQTLAPELAILKSYNETEQAELLVFLDALTAPSAIDLSYLLPESVPSGLPMQD